MLVFSFFYPIALFLILKYLGLGLDDAFVLKFIPLALSIYVTGMIVFSYRKNNSFILSFAKRFSKKTLSEEEKNYIQKSTRFWIGICLVNIFLHVSFLLQSNAYYWVAYSSFGWYFVFGFGGVLQYFHKKLIFEKRVKNA